MLVMYVVLDGFDLGVGIISLFADSEERRDVMMASLGSIWDANETWLVVFAGALFGAFPVAYGALLHALYIPVTAMLFALIFRGIAFEFREHARRKLPWNIAFGLGSLLAALSQGYALGAVIGGLAVRDGAFVGGVWDWFSPTATLVAVGVVFGYTLLGTTYLLLKTEGPYQGTCARRARLMAWLTVLAGIGVSLWTPLRFSYVMARWFDWPNIIYLAPLPAIALFAFVMLLRALNRGYERAPFFWTVAIFLTSFAGLAVSLYPYFIPLHLRLSEGSASSPTLVFMLAGIGMLIPIMLIYNGYQYLVFRGKTRPGQGYSG